MKKPKVSFEKKTKIAGHEVTIRSTEFKIECPSKEDILPLHLKACLVPNEKGEEKLKWKVASGFQLLTLKGDWVTDPMMPAGYYKGNMLVDYYFDTLEKAYGAAEKWYSAELEKKEK